MAMGKILIDRRALLVGIAGPALSYPAKAQNSGTLPPEAIRQDIASAALYSRFALPLLWSGAPDAGFQLLLVGADREFLFHGPDTVDGFECAGFDAITGSRVFVRPRQYAPSFLATFPAVGGIPTIVVGFPEATAQPERPGWSLTLLHEHFHQRTLSAPGYFDRTLALDLADGDETGMWMLNYPFPYEDAAIGTAFSELTAKLLAAIEGGERETAAYLAARARLRDALPDRDWRYLGLQCWQEGVARFAEIELGAAALRSDWVATAATKRDELQGAIARADLAAQQRIVFYALGAGEATLLSRLLPQWRETYFTGEPSLDHHFGALVAT